MKIFFIVLLFSLFQPLFSQSIKITPEIYHLGTIPDSQNVYCKFEISNLSTDQILRITSIKTFCSCTVVGQNQFELEPQAKQFLAVEFNPRGRFGYLRWEIQLQYYFADKNQSIKNNVEGQLLKAIFDVNILRDYYLSHNSIFLDEFKQGKQFTKQIYISPKEYPEFNISKMQWTGIPSAKYFSFSYQPEMYEGFYPEKRLAQCIKVSPKGDIPYGAIQGKLILQTNWPEHPIIEIDVLGKVSSDIAMNRNYLSFGVVPPNGKVQRDVLVYAVEEKQSFDITKIECDLPFIQTEIKPLFPQRYFQIYVTAIDSSNIPMGEFRSQLKLKTSLVNQPELILPIQGIILPRNK